MFRCPDCRTRRKDYGLFTQHLQQSGHKLCGCGGMHYKHRPGTKFCESHPDYELHMMARYGATDEDLLDFLVERALEQPGITAKAGEEPPF